METEIQISENQLRGAKLLMSVGHNITFYQALMCVLKNEELIYRAALADGIKRLADEFGAKDFYSH